MPRRVLTHSTWKTIISDVHCFIKYNLCGSWFDIIIVQWEEASLLYPWTWARCCHCLITKQTEGFTVFDFNICLIFNVSCQVNHVLIFNSRKFSISRWLGFIKYNKYQIFPVFIQTYLPMVRLICHVDPVQVVFSSKVPSSFNIRTVPKLTSRSVSLNISLYY